MKLLKKEEIELVNPKFRQLVLDAWKRGEGVPYGIVNLSEAPITRKDAQKARDLIKQVKLNAVVTQLEE